MRRLLALGAVLALGACALRPPSPDTFAFAVMGDTPYSALEEAAFPRLIDTLNAEALAFVVHVGDFKSSGAPCSDALFEERRAALDRSRHPVAYTPGDNEWVDCRRKAAGGWDPLERLEKLRRLFFSGAGFVGPAGGPIAEVMTACARTGATGCECPALPENRRWERRLAASAQRVVFTTLNVQGSNDNRGFDAANDRESDCRGVANRAWLAEAFATGSKPAAVVVIFHANPLAASRGDVHRPLLDALTREAQAFGGPVLVVHGDTHRYRVDHPFRDAQDLPVQNMTRLESFGSPFSGWVLVTVDPADPQFFRFTPRGIE